MLTRPIFGCKGGGAICTVLLIPKVRLSSSSSPHFGTWNPPKACFAGPCVVGAHRQPRVINTDLAPTYPRAMAELKHNGTLRRRCRHRPVQYLNNIIEQDHRAIKKRVNAKQGFRAFGAARRTIEGYEAMHMLRKGQVRWVAANDVRAQVRFIHLLFGIAF